MPRKRNPVPSYLHHKPTGRAFVKIGTKFVYLGEYGSKESKAAYSKLVAGLTARPAEAPSPAAALPAAGCLVADLVAAFLDRTMPGYSKSERSYYAAACGILLAVADGLTPADFGPRALAEVRDAMVARGWTREHVNAQVRRVRKVFRWGESVELVPAGKWFQLRSLEGLGRGKTTAKDQRKKTPVADEVVERTIPFLSPTVAAMVRFQRLTGCRPQDVCRLNAAEIDRTRTVWVFRPAKHKGAWRGQSHTVYIGPRAQAVILPYLEGREDAPAVFSPRIAWGERRAMTKAGGRRNYTPKGPPVSVGEVYDTMAYLRAVERGIARANAVAERPADAVPDWRPGDLRHAAATDYRQKCGLETAQKLLDHKSASTTEIYAKLVDDQAESAAMEHG